MLLTIIGVFLLCWGPKLLLNIFKRFELSFTHEKSGYIFMVRAHKLLPWNILGVVFF